MCKVFVKGDPALWQVHLKSVRMRGFSTSVRLENLYWMVLSEIAARDGITLTHLLVTLYEELLEECGEVDNFASFLRVCCGRYLMMQLSGEVPREPATPIRQLDADRILTLEERRLRPQRPRERARVAVAH